MLMILHNEYQAKLNGLASQRSLGFTRSADTGMGMTSMRMSSTG